jgi:hypothetical protein
MIKMEKSLFAISRSQSEVRKSFLGFRLAINDVTGTRQGGLELKGVSEGGWGPIFQTGKTNPKLKTGK